MAQISQYNPDMACGRALPLFAIAHARKIISISPKGSHRSNVLPFRLFRSPATSCEVMATRSNTLGRVLAVLTYTQNVASFLVQESRIALTKIKKSFHGLRVNTKHVLWRSKNGWHELTAGMEVEELWTQFKMEAEESSLLYKQDFNEHAERREQPWKQPFNMLGILFWSVLKKLSPARRLFLLSTIFLAFLSVMGFHFLFFTQELEFILAFVGLLILLALVPGDHISMKRDIEIAREIQRWLVPHRPPMCPVLILLLLLVPPRPSVEIIMMRFAVQPMARY
jgi:hypothetical protein